MTDRVLQALIADDEPVARRIVRGLLEADPEIEVAGECAGAETVEHIVQGRPDIVFLDVQMPGMTGFEVLEAVAATYVPVVVFVTAYDEYAIKAFELRAVDYLLKPFSDRRFLAALGHAKEAARSRDEARVQRRLQALLAGLAGPDAAPDEIEPFDGRAYRDRLVVKNQGRVSLLPVDQIDWIESVGPYARVYSDGKSHLIRIALRELEESFDPRRFFRIHRSAIVNLDRVKELTHWSHGDYLVVLHDGTELKLSRTRRTELEKVLGSRI